MAVITNYVHCTEADGKRKYAITGQIKKRRYSKLDDVMTMVGEPMRPQQAEYDAAEDKFSTHIKAFLYCMKTAKHIGANEADRFYIWSTDKSVVDAISDKTITTPNEQHLDLFWELKNELGVRFGYQSTDKPNRFVKYAVELCAS